MTNPVKAISLSLLLLLPSPVLAAGDWNDAKIKWLPYTDGLATAKKDNKPICLIVFTDWCPHCTNYSKVFHDPKVVAETKNFVMIRLNGDQEKEVSKEYAVDGAYIPRTYFLSSSGKVDEAVHAPRDKFKYFYDESNPAGILAGMETAKKKLK